MPPWRIRPAIYHYGLMSVVGLILLWCYIPVLVRLGMVWWTDAYAFHVPLVPLFSIFLIWQQRDTLAMLPRRPCVGGLLLLGVALTLLAVGRSWHDLTLMTGSGVVLLWGGVLLYGGVPLVRRLAFPLGFLALMLPFPHWAVDAVSLPFQQLAAWAGAIGLSILGIPVYREGLLIHLPTLTLKVTELCNGLKYLMALMVFAVAFAHMTQGRVWQRLLVVLSAIPFALMANALRVVGTGVLGNAFGRDLITGLPHAYFGKAVYIIVLALYIGYGFGLRQLSRWLRRRPIAVPEDGQVASGAQAVVCMNSFRTGSQP